MERIAPSGSTTTVSKTSSSHLLWSFEQMLAHHSISGCPMRTGDLLGSGTISGTEDGSQGSLVERTQGGKTPITLQNGEKRSFFEDGDTVTIRGWCAGKTGALVGFGECAGQIMPALKFD
jgi:fumarylacetoacetase